MNKKTNIYLLISALIVCFNSKLSASHIFATNITCTYAGTPNTYNISFKLYRDCSGISAPATVPLCYSSASLATSNTVTLNPIAGTGQEVTLAPCYQPGTSSSCSGGNTVGIQEYVYEGILVLPAAAADWVVSYSDCCRANNVTNLASGYAHLYTTLDNLNFPTNSTPQFNFPAWAQYCINTPSSHSFSATDIDGDVLVYTLDNCLASSGCPAINAIEPYLTPYTVSTPFSSSAPINLNSSTGEMTFNPDILQYATVAVNISEYRNGQLVSVTHREDLIASIIGVIGTDTISGKAFHDINANTVYDAGEPGMNGQIIEITPGPYYYSTNINGDYDALVPINNYNITVHTNYPFYYPAVMNHTANFTSFGQSDAGNNFAFSVLGNVQDLRVSLAGGNVRPNTSSNIYVSATNMGVTVNNAIVNLTLDPSYTYNSATPTPASVVGNTISWNIPSIQILQSQNFTVNVSTGNLPLWTVLNSSAEILPVAGDTVPDDNIDSLAQIVVNSFDPNRKNVFPDDWITTTQIDNGLYLEYTVLFQNIGNAPAIDVVILDTLDPYFNIPTFEILSASHPFSWQMTGQGAITYTFHNIMLPDSASNEPASHGYVKYRVRPQNNLFQNQKIVNIAYIYFDNNPPIVTNYTSTHVYHFTGINDLKRDDAFALYPNPANSNVSVILQNDLAPNARQTMLVKINDVFGKEILSKQFLPDTRKQITINTEHIPAGIYFVSIQGNNKNYVKKLVIE